MNRLQWLVLFLILSSFAIMSLALTCGDDDDDDWDESDDDDSAATVICFYECWVNDGGDLPSYLIGCIEAKSEEDCRRTAEADDYCTVENIAVTTECDSCCGVECWPDWWLGGIPDDNCGPLDPDKCQELMEYDDACGDFFEEEDCDTLWIYDVYYCYLHFGINDCETYDIECGFGL